jgi:hypothetical protein
LRYAFEVGNSPSGIFLVVQEVFPNIQFGFIVSQLHCAEEPVESALELPFVPPEHSHVVGCAGVASPVRSLIPVQSCRAISPNTLSAVIIVADIYLGSGVPQFCSSQHEAKGRSHLASLILFVSASKQPVGPRFVSQPGQLNDPRPVKS